MQPSDQSIPEKSPADPALCGEDLFVLPEPSEHVQFLMPEGHPEAAYIQPLRE